MPHLKWSLNSILFFNIFISHRHSCNGNYQCINECNAPQIDRCSGCSVFNDDSNQILTNCDAGKWLYYVEVPKNISVNDFVSNTNLLSLYTNSNLELNSSGITGRACLNNNTRFDLQRLNATIHSIPNVKKWKPSIDNNYSCALFIWF